MQAKAIQKKAQKWTKVDELEGPSLKLIATILANGGPKCYEEEFELFTSKKLTKKLQISKNDKKQTQILEAFRKLLTGIAPINRTCWWPHNGRQAVGFVGSPNVPPFEFVPLADSYKKLSVRLGYIIATIFAKKTSTIKNLDALHVCTDIALQICSHR
jgi:hypothetical protein